MRTPNRILLELLKRRTTSKGDLSEIVGVSKSTISYFIAKMSKMGVIETERVRGRRGRPREYVSISGNAWSVLGIKVGREEVVGAKFDAKLRVVDVLERPVTHDLRNGRGYSDLVADVIRSLIDADVVAVGVAISGVVDRGRVRSEILGIDELDLQDFVEFVSGTPSVVVMNDVEALAIYESYFHGGTRFLVVNYGTGIGAAFYDGKILKAGDRTIFQIGHVVVDPQGEECYCGKRGCLETVASDYANLKRYTGADFTIKEFVEYEWERFEEDLRKMRKMASRGEIPRVYEPSVEYLGLVLSNIIHMLEPERLAFYGEGASEWLVDRLKEKVSGILMRDLTFACRCEERLAFEKGVALSACENFIRSFRLS